MQPEMVEADLSLLNGTSPADWGDITDMRPPAGKRFLRALGVHPWKVNLELTPDWEKQLRELVSDSEGVVAIGEIGLDRWIEPRDEDAQERVFRRQLRLAGELGLPPVIHCLRAWDSLLRILKEEPLPERGFQVHGFGGSGEVQRQLLKLGAHFSFSAYALSPRRKRMREAVRACPPDRLLIETDAPDMVPDRAICRFPRKDPEGNRIHDPREIRTAYAGIAELRGEELSGLRVRVAANFARLFATQLDV